MSNATLQQMVREASKRFGAHDASSPAQVQDRLYDIARRCFRLGQLSIAPRDLTNAAASEDEPITMPPGRDFELFGSAWIGVGAAERTGHKQLSLRLLTTRLALDVAIYVRHEEMEKPLAEISVPFQSL